MERDRPLAMRSPCFIVCTLKGPCGLIYQWLLSKGLQLTCEEKNEKQGGDHCAMLAGMYMYIEIGTITASNYPTSNQRVRRNNVNILGTLATS